MIGRVIVPLDGSDLSERAVALGALLARSVGATLVLVSVTAPPLDVESQAHEASISRYLKNLVDMLPSDGLAARLEVLYGEPAEEIGRLCRPGDLLVMSTHGRSGLSLLLQGSVAAELLRLAPCPVLLVRPALRVPTLAELGAPSEVPPAVPDPDATPTWEAMLGPVHGFGSEALEHLRAFAEFARERWPVEYEFRAGPT